MELLEIMQNRRSVRKYTEESVKEEDLKKILLGYPQNYKLEATLVLGMPAEHGPAYELEKLPVEKIHEGAFGRAMEWK